MSHQRGRSPGTPSQQRGEGRSHSAAALTEAEAASAGRRAAPPASSLPGGGLVLADTEVRANQERARVLCLTAGILPGLVVGLVLGLVVAPVAGAVGALVVLVLVAVGLWRGATRLALRLVGGAAVDEDDEVRLATLVEGLCATFGVPQPRLWLVEDPVPNACALGRDPGDAVLVVTSGLLDRLGLIEMEGVVAHELAHIRRRDTTVAGVAVGFLWPLVALTGNDRLVHAAVGLGREYRADQVAAFTVRYPPGLHDALAMIQAGPAPRPRSVFTGRRWAATRWLWIDPMVGERAAATVGQLDATGVRQAALAEW